MVAPPTLEDVVRHCHALAKQAMHDLSPDLAPARNGFLINTWISYYHCQFGEPTPHVVRWIPQKHPLLTFFHWHQLRHTPTPLSLETCVYGRVALYAENEVQRYVGYLIQFCQEMGLPVAPSTETQVPLTPPSTKVAEDGEMVDVSLVDVDDEMSVYVTRVYKEICALMVDRRRRSPCYDDIFYNMSKTPVRVGSSHVQFCWWMDSKHAFTAHPLMRQIPPAGQFNTYYGTYSIYEDQYVMRVADALWKEFSVRGLLIEVNPITATAHLNGVITGSAAADEAVQV